MRTSWRVFCSEIERVSSGGAAAKISLTPCGGACGSAYQVTNAVLPDWATRPTYERPSAGSSRYHGISSSSRRSAADMSRPLPSRRRWRLSALPAGPLGAVALAGVLGEAVTRRAYGPALWTVHKRGRPAVRLVARRPAGG